MNTDKPDLHESPSPDIQTDEIQVGTKRVPNKRICAYLIDIFIINLVYSVLTAVIAGIPDIALSLLFGLLLIAYLLIRDALFHGQSIGKYTVGLRVVDMEGQPCDLRKSGLRNLIFIVPVLIFGIVSLLPEPVESSADVPNIPLYIYALIFIAVATDIIEYFVMRASKWERRLGDRMAGTKVQDLRPDRPDWWFLLFSLLIVVLLFSVGPSMTPPSPG